MQYFMDTSETIPDGMGFSYFSLEHLICLGIAGVIIASGAILYVKSNILWRGRIRCLLSGVAVAAELFKQIMLLVGNRWLACYLPLHLCSINVFLIVWYTLRKNQMIGCFLYGVCLPAAVAAILFPGWNDLPAWNFMSLHSWSLHIVLVIYPLALTLAGDIRPTISDGIKSFLLLVCLSVFFFGLNWLLYQKEIYVNFFFLRTVSKNNPLYVFESLLGTYRYGLILVVLAVQFIMYCPLAVRQLNINDPES